MLQRLSRRLGRQLRRFARGERASVAIETAFVAPFFFGMIGIILETGLMMFMEYAIQAGVQEAGRYVRTGQAQANGWNQMKLRQIVCNTAAVGLPNCQTKLAVRVTASTNFTTLQTSTPTLANVGADASGALPPDPANVACGQRLEVVSIMATYDHKFIMPFMQFYKNTALGSDRRRLTGFAMFRNEPFPAGGACT